MTPDEASQLIKKAAKDPWKVSPFYIVPTPTEPKPPKAKKPHKPRHQKGRKKSV